MVPRPLPILIPLRALNCRAPQASPSTSRFRHQLRLRHGDPRRGSGHAPSVSHLQHRPQRLCLQADHRRQRLGCRVGTIQGTVFAVGPALDYTFKIGQLPVATNLRYFYEFGVNNRLKGHAGLLKLQFRLAGIRQSNQATDADWPGLSFPGAPQIEMWTSEAGATRRPSRSATVEHSVNSHRSGTSSQYARKAMMTLTKPRLCGDLSAHTGPPGLNSCSELHIVGLETISEGSEFGAYSRRRRAAALDVAGISRGSLSDSAAGVGEHGGPSFATCHSME